MNKKDPWEYVAFVAIGMGIFGVVFSVASLFGYSPSFFSQDDKIAEEDVSNTLPAASKQDHFSAATFTAFDVELAKQFMDKDGDGKCDICGMDIDMCISSGMLQCSGMDPDATIGLLDTTKKKHHYHADFAVFLDGKQVDFNQEKYFVKSRFMHVENDPQGDSSKVLHMHAEGVPLWLFFESLGMNFTKECFVSDTGKDYCNTEEKSLKFYVNGVENSEYGDYIFKDNDKILISYGAESEEELAEQQSTVTDFAKNH